MGFSAKRRATSQISNQQPFADENSNDDDVPDIPVKADASVLAKRK